MGKCCAVHKRRLVGVYATFLFSMRFILVRVSVDLEPILGSLNDWKKYTIHEYTTGYHAHTVSCLGPI